MSLSASSILETDRDVCKIWHSDASFGEAWNAMVIHTKAMVVTRAERENSKTKRNELSVDFAASHHLEMDEVLRLLETDLERGLSTQEAKRRLEKFGPNKLSAPRHASALRRFLLQFSQP